MEKIIGLVSFLKFICCSINVEFLEKEEESEEVFVRKMQDILSMYKSDPVAFVSDSKIDVVSPDIIAEMERRLFSCDLEGLCNYLRGILHAGGKSVLFPIVLMLAKASGRCSRVTFKASKNLTLW